MLLLRENFILHLFHYAIFKHCHPFTIRVRLKMPLRHFQGAKRVLKHSHRGHCREIEGKLF